MATALVWNMIYGKDTGLLNYMLEHLGLAPVCWLCASNVMFAVVIVNVWGAIGEGMIIFLAGLTAIPQRLLRSSQHRWCERRPAVLSSDDPPDHAQHIFPDVDRYDQCLPGV